jgi:hypothetical protein
MVYGAEREGNAPVVNDVKIRFRVGGFIGTDAELLELKICGD